MSEPKPENDAVAEVLAAHRWLGHEDQSGWGDCACADLTTNDRDEHERHVADAIRARGAARVIAVTLGGPDDEPGDWYAFCDACPWYGAYRQDPEKADSDAAEHRCDSAITPDSTGGESA